jgi:hypothetical protein
MEENHTSIITDTKIKTLIDSLGSTNILPGMIAYPDPDYNVLLDAELLGEIPDRICLENLRSKS